jgi:hypothetical protein
MFDKSTFFYKTNPNFPVFRLKTTIVLKNEPKRTQNEPNLSKGVKMIQAQYLQRIMNKNPNFGFVKTKPFKTNNQSSLIDNHLEGEPKQSQFLSKSPSARLSILHACPYPAVH